jgi:hypothetical protein
MRQPFFSPLFCFCWIWDSVSGSGLNFLNPCHTELILIRLLITQNINDTERFRMQPYVEVDKIQSYCNQNSLQSSWVVLAPSRLLICMIVLSPQMVLSSTPPSPPYH